MTQVSLVENKKNNIDLVLQPIKNDTEINEAIILSLIEESEYSHLELSISNVRNTVAELNSILKPLQQHQTGREFRYQVLKRKDAVIEIKIDPDEMSASAEVTTAIGGKNLTAKDILDSAQATGVKKGFEKKGILHLVQASAIEPAGTLIKAVIANGKLPINGSDARVQPLVQCAQDRILRPKEREDGSVDMKDLGDIICVRIGEPLAQVVPLTPGVDGFTVKGVALTPNPGEDIAFTVGEGTRINPKNKNILISTSVGLPRSINNGIAIDEVYKLKNVDATTGHVNFEGSVIVDGDVCEGMKVEAKGDITIGGAVESAFLKAGGDITVLGGIIGKKQEAEDLSTSDLVMSANLKADGNIFSKYCQYADVSCKKFTVSNQLMHSIINVTDRLWVGSEEKADGKLIAGYINAVNSVHAGTIGATAGSATTITFEHKIKEYKQKISEVDEQLKIETIKAQEVKATTQKIKSLPKGKVPPEMIKKIISTYEHHARKVNEFHIEKEIIESQVKTYMNEIVIEATERIYHGVKFNIGEFNEKTKREHGPSKMYYAQRRVHIEPIIHS